MGMTSNRSLLCASLRKIISRCLRVHLSRSHYLQDLHFREDAWTDWGPQQDVNYIKVMSTVLDKEQPDFVIYLGDVITANNIPTENASLYWDQAISPTRNRGVPWASVFGNHDDAPFEWPATGIPQLNCTGANVSTPASKVQRLELMQNEIQHNTLSYSKSGPKNLWPSVSNYVLKLSSSSDPQLAMAYMYFFDSGGGSYLEVISSAQADWFQHISQQVNPESRVSEIIFWHIPSQAYNHVDPRFSLDKSCVGSMFTEKVAAQEELGIMKLLEARSSVKVTTMDWTGVAPTRSFSCAMQDTLAMVDMEIGLEELEFWRSLSSPSLSSHGL